MLFRPEDLCFNGLACVLVAGPTLPLHLNAVTHRGPRPLKRQHRHRVSTSRRPINQANEDKAPRESNAKKMTRGSFQSVRANTVSGWKCDKKAEIRCSPTGV